MGWQTRLYPGVTPNQKIFCNTPWYELHIYWDGSFGICCQESHKLYSSQEKHYNIASMSIPEWFNSEPVNRFRREILEHKKLSECQRCYKEELYNGDSRRLRSNQKSVIFTQQAFEHSLQQSPAYKEFEYSHQHQGKTQTWPIDLHIDLGNFCNLACKMCNSQASSTIASQEVRWGIESSRQYLGTDWTRNIDVWNNFKNQLLQLSGLKNIHFMGGETLLTDRFEDLVDFMTMHERFDVCFSFVTNGTVFRPELINKLKRFSRVGIEISIETVDEHNAYQRQGTDTNLVLENIQKFVTLCNGTSMTVSLRPAPSILTIGYYASLLRYALKNKLVVKSNLCYEPRFLSAEILPNSIKKMYQAQYKQLLIELADIDDCQDYNASNPDSYKQIAKVHAKMCMAILQSTQPQDSDQQLEKLVRHCEQWDRVYGYDAKKLYPEFQPLLDRYGYSTSG